METTNDPPIRPIDPIKVQFDNFHMHKIVDQCIHSHCHSKLVLALSTNSWFPTVHWTLGWLDWVCPVAVGVVYKEKLRPAPPSASAGAWGLLQVQVTTDHWPLVYTTRVWWNVQPTLTLLHTSYLRLFQVQLIFSTSQKYPLPPTMSQIVINGLKIGFWIDWQLIRYCFWTNDSETILCTLH